MGMPNYPSVVFEGADDFKITLRVAFNNELKDL